MDQSLIKALEVKKMAFISGMGTYKDSLDKEIKVSRDTDASTKE